MNIFLEIGVPNWRTVFKFRSDIGDKGFKQGPDIFGILYRPRSFLYGSTSAVLVCLRIDYTTLHCNRTIIIENHIITQIIAIFMRSLSFITCSMIVVKVII